MMKWVFSGLIVFSVIFGIIAGRMNEVSNAAIASCGDAVGLMITLTGSMCLWSGLMKVADRACLTEKISGLFSPLIKVLFGGMDHKSESAKAITLNISANLLGLGNAATPLGIAAMRAMDKENNHGKTASNNMIIFVVLNTASMQLIPTTTAILRQAAGSSRPLDIMPAVWVSSFVSVASGIIMCKLLSGFIGQRVNARAAKSASQRKHTGNAQRL